MHLARYLNFPVYAKRTKDRLSGRSPSRLRARNPVGSEKGEIASVQNLSDVEEDPPGVPSGPCDIFSRTFHRLAALHGVPVEDVVGGSRKYHAVQVRREVLMVCKSEIEVSVVQLAHWLGIKENAAAYLLKSGREVALK